MPIFEYICKECEHQFEIIVNGSTRVECPSCKSKRLEKQLSIFAANVNGRSSSSRELPVGPCGTCGDPRGPGACSLSNMN